MPALTRGPLPPGVYWRRRVFAVGLVLSLVFVVVSMVRGGGEEPPPSAQQAAVETDDGSSSETGTEADDEVEESDDEVPRRGRRSREALPEPDGPCSADDVAVRPRVDEAVAGPSGRVRITLVLRTEEAEACDWRVGPRTTALRISSGDDEIWSTQECRGELSRSDVVVRRATPVEVELTWDARRSEPGCPAETRWALPGFYYVAASTLGGEPRDVQFELLSPADAEAQGDDDAGDEQPKRRQRQDRQDRQDEQQDGQEEQPDGQEEQPDGAVEPDVLR